MLSTDTYNDIASVTLWFKIQDNDSLVLSDIPSLIPLKWPEIRDQWDIYFKPQLLKQVPGYTTPDQLKQQIDAFDTFINQQRIIATAFNPLSDKTFFYKFFCVFDALSLDSLSMTAAEFDIVDTVTRTVNNYTRTDWLAVRDRLQAANDLLADTTGTSDSTYNQIFNRSSSSSAQTTITTDDLNQMKALLDTIKSIDFIIVNKASAKISPFDPFVLAKANANNPDINIGDYTAGTLLKLNYNESLQQLAARTLGDSDKWIDIALANGLKPPYIDEVGQNIFLTVNGHGNQINLLQFDPSGAPNISKFYINHVVQLQSNTQLMPDQRSIIDIKQVPVSGDIILTLSGLPNLNQYTVVDNAYIRVFAPHTTNSQFYILIPSNQPVPPSALTSVPFFLQTTPADEQQAKIDLLLTASNDLATVGNQDFVLSYGLENVAQAIKLKLIIEQGELERHQEFGLIPVVGTTNVNLDTTKTKLITCITNMIDADPRFDRIEQLNVQYLVTTDNSFPAAAYLIKLRVSLAGSSAVVPITFQVSI